MLPDCTVYPKFESSSILLCLYSLVCVGTGQKPHCWFSHEAAYILVLRSDGRVGFDLRWFKDRIESIHGIWKVIKIVTVQMLNNCIRKRGTLPRVTIELFQMPLLTSDPSMVKITPYCLIM